MVGGGLAGLSAGWRLRSWDTVVLEADDRVGGRIRSERRGPYWLNWGGHVFAGAGSSTDALLDEVGVPAVAVPGSLTGLSMNGRFIPRGRIETYPFRVPMPLVDRAAVGATGLRVMLAVARYARVVRQRPGESPESRQQRIYDFENDRSFADFIGDLPADAAALFQTTVTRSAGDMDQISAGAGIGYFGMIWDIGQGGLNRGILGGPSTLTEAAASALGARVQLGAEVHEIVHRPGSVLVRYGQGGADHEVEARCLVLATPATVAHRIAVDLPVDVREALGAVRYGPHVSAAFLTDETSARPWDDCYAIASPKRSFAIALNQASIIRGRETSRQPGGSIMTFSPASLGRALIDSSDEEILARHLADLEQVLGSGFADSVVEASASRWRDGSPYSFPGRSTLQPTLTRRSGRVFLAGDYLGTLYTESAISTGFAAARSAVDLLVSEVPSRDASSPPHSPAMPGSPVPGRTS